MSISRFRATSAYKKTSSTLCSTLLFSCIAIPYYIPVPWFLSNFLLHANLEHAKDMAIRQFACSVRSRRSPQTYSRHVRKYNVRQYKKTFCELDK